MEKLSLTLSWAAALNNKTLHTSLRTNIQNTSVWFSLPHSFSNSFTHYYIITYSAHSHLHYHVFKSESAQLNIFNVVLNYQVYEVLKRTRCTRAKYSMGKAFISTRDQSICNYSGSFLNTLQHNYHLRGSQLVRSSLPVCQTIATCLHLLCHLHSTVPTESYS